MNTPDDVGTTSTSSASEDATAHVQLSPFPKRIVEVFFSPGRLVEGLAAKPLWGAALALGAALVLLQTVLIPTEVWQTMVREQMIARGQDPSAAVAGAAMIRVFGTVGGTLAYLVMAMLFAGIATLVFAFVMGDEGRFKQYLAVLTHAMLIPGIVGLALVPLRIAQADPQLTLNVGTFLFFLPEGYLLRWATLLDLTALWSWLVLAQGAHAIDQKRSFGSAAAVLVSLFVVIMALFALIPGAG